jgi:hypothetical protein
MPVAGRPPSQAAVTPRRQPPALGPAPTMSVGPALAAGSRRRRRWRYQTGGPTPGLPCTAAGPPPLRLARRRRRRNPAAARSAVRAAVQPAAAGPPPPQTQTQTKRRQSMRRRHWGLRPHRAPRRRKGLPGRNVCAGTGGSAEARFAAGVLVERTGPGRRGRAGRFLLARAPSMPHGRAIVSRVLRRARA